MLAQLRRADRVRKRPTLGVDRTYDGHHESDANGPKPTLSVPVLAHLVGAHFRSSCAHLDQAIR